MNEKVKKFLVHEKITVKEAMRRMGDVAERILFVVNEDNHLIGSLSDGDIRRWVIEDGAIMATIEGVFNEQFIYVNENYDRDVVRKIMIRQKIQGVPVIKADKNVVTILLWSEIFDDQEEVPLEKIDLPVVIMAGGKGTRLDPFTKILPKPLIPVRDKTILEFIIDKYRRHGVNDFYLSINHKAKMIKAYFEEISPSYKIHYIEEGEPLGTAGSLKFMDMIAAESLIVSNCDIIIESDYHDIVEFHNSKNYDITIVGSFRHFTIPYGVCRMQTGGTLIDIQEKPEYDFLVNTGMYILKKDVLKHIPRDEFFHFTDLIQAVQEQGGNVGVFPIDEKSWIDVGQWSEYRQAVAVLESQGGYLSE